jgi:hypothetical protein
MSPGTGLLKEYKLTRQIAGEPKRRWFSTDDLDLIVWLNEKEQPFAFQFCYDKRTREHAITWEAGHGFEHSAIDAGEGNALQHKGSPTLIAAGPFDHERVERVFLDSGAELPEPIHRMVAAALKAYPQSPALDARRPAEFVEPETAPWWRFWK